MGTNNSAELMKIDNIFVPSVFNGTYCDIVYSTYYDYNDFTYLRNRINHMNLPISKCIRIRSYHFNPNKYLEVKYSGGTKIRALINNDYELIEADKIEDEYRDFLFDIMNKIKHKKIQPIFNNIYKRLSFIYKNDPSIRVTMDTNIEFFYKNVYHKMNNDILEIKVPININVATVKQWLQEINKLTNLDLHFTQFSKFEYYYYNVIINRMN
jgi:SPX domain protein involved in polyphosphate accumulation